MIQIERDDAGRIVGIDWDEGTGCVLTLVAFALASAVFYHCAR
jgi:hypothetical protein